MLTQPLQEELRQSDLSQHCLSRENFSQGLSHSKVFISKEIDNRLKKSSFFLN